MEIQRSHSRFLSVLQHCLHSFNLVKNLQTMAALGSTEADGGRCDLVRSGGLDLTHEVLHNLLVTTVIILIYKVLSGSVSMKEKSAYIYIYTRIHICIYIYVCMYVCKDIWKSLQKRRWRYVDHKLFWPGPRNPSQRVRSLVPGLQALARGYVLPAVSRELVGQCKRSSLPCTPPLLKPRRKARAASSRSDPQQVSATGRKSRNTVQLFYPKVWTSPIQVLIIQVNCRRNRSFAYSLVKEKCKWPCMREPGKNYRRTLIFS